MVGLQDDIFNGCGIGAPSTNTCTPTQSVIEWASPARGIVTLNARIGDPEHAVRGYERATRLPERAVNVPEC